jgi:hypothetical protein
MAYLPTPVTEWTAPGILGRIPVHTLTKILILELGNVRRHGGTLQHPVHSGNHGIALCTTTVHARMHVRTDRAHFLIRLQSIAQSLPLLALVITRAVCDGAAPGIQLGIGPESADTLKPPWSALSRRRLPASA